MQIAIVHKVTSIVLGVIRICFSQWRLQRGNGRNLSLGCVVCNLQIHGPLDAVRLRTSLNSKLKTVNNQLRRSLCDEICCLRLLFWRLRKTRSIYYLSSVISYQHQAYFSLVSLQQTDGDGFSLCAKRFHFVAMLLHIFACATTSLLLQICAMGPAVLYSRDVTCTQV